MRILIIEDEKKTADYLQQGLEENGFTVEVADNGEDGLHLATSEDEIDLVILDVMLPRHDGWSIIGALRGGGWQMPVLFLTARDSVQDRVRGLELGADDYLVKPFAFSELLARVRTLLRRKPLQQLDTLRVAGLEVDLLRHCAIRNGIRLDLTPKEFSLLALFVQRTGEVLSRTLISEHVWGMDFDSDANVIDVAIRRLRAKVDAPFEKELIHTVRGVGYVLEAR